MADLRWETADGWSYGFVPGEDEPAYTCELGEDRIWRAEGPGGEDLGWGELDDVQGLCSKHRRGHGG